jgi:hypothetical protein
MSLLFDANSGGVSCGSSLSLLMDGSVTYLTWVIPTTQRIVGLGDPRVFQVNIGSATTTQAQLLIWSGTQGGTTSPRVSFEQDYSTTVMFSVTSIGIPLNTPTHIGVVYRGGSNATDITYYINGSQIAGLETSQNGSGSKRVPDGIFYVGNRHDATRWNTGQILSFDAYREVLTPEKIEIAAKSRIFTVPKMLASTPSNHVLSLWFNEFPDGAIASGSNSIMDYSGNSNFGTPYNSPVAKASGVLSYQ